MRPEELSDCSVPHLLIIANTQQLEILVTALLTMALHAFILVISALIPPFPLDIA